MSRYLVRFADESANPFTGKTRGLWIFTTEFGTDIIRKIDELEAGPNGPGANLNWLGSRMSSATLIYRWVKEFGDKDIEKYTFMAHPWHRVVVEVFDNVVIEIIGASDRYRKLWRGASFWTFKMANPYLKKEEAVSNPATVSKVERYSFESFSAGACVATFTDDKLCLIEKADGAGLLMPAFQANWHGCQLKTFLNVYGDAKKIEDKNPWDLLIAEIEKYRETRKDHEAGYKTINLGNAQPFEIIGRFRTEGRLFAVDEILAIINRIRPR